MSDLHELTADVRVHLDDAGFKGDQIDGIVHAIWPALQRAVAENLEQRNRIARELADLRDDIDTRVTAAVVAALRNVAQQIEEGEVAP